MKYVIVYDEILDDGAILPQKAFFGYDDGVPAVLHNGAKVFEYEDDATLKLRLAAVVSKDLTLSAPYIVCVP